MAMKVTWHEQGFLDLLQHPAIQDDLNRRGQAIAEAAGEGFELRTPTLNPRRDRVMIVAATRRANRRNARDMTLVRALEAGRE